MNWKLIRTRKEFEAWADTHMIPHDQLKTKGFPFAVTTFAPMDFIILGQNPTIIAVIDKDEITRLKKEVGRKK
jgi:hypothetical protein